MEFSEVKEKHFYLINVINRSYNSNITPKVKCVAKCTQIQNFMEGRGYINVHFKCWSGFYFNDTYVISERIATYGSKYKYENHNSGIELLEEITDDKLKDTSIIFIDDTHYKKLVNKGIYKEYEL